MYRKVNWHEPRGKARTLFSATSYGRLNHVCLSAKAKRESGLKTSSKIVAYGIIFVFIVGMLFGCNKLSNPEVTHIDDVPLNRRIGQIQSLGGIKTASQGTHLLKLDDGNIILLRSLSVNLDDQKYQGKIVEIRGYLNYTTSKKQIMDVQNIDVIDIAQTQEKLIVNWKEYVNPSLGFEARYRDDFKIKEGLNFARFVRPVGKPQPQSTTQTQTITQTITGLKEHVILVESSQKNPDISDTQQIDIKTAVKSKIGSNGLDAYKKVDDSLKKIDFYFKYSGKYYHIGYIGSETAQNLEDQNVFYDFINSFRLIKADI